MNLISNKNDIPKEELYVHPLQAVLQQHNKMEIQRKREFPQQIFGSGLVADLADNEIIFGSKLRLPGLPQSNLGKEFLEVNGESTLGYEGWFHEMRMGGDDIEEDIHTQSAKTLRLNEIKFI